MAHRLTSHHRALFSPKYLSGTSAHITTTSYFRAPFDVKDKDDFDKRVLASEKPILVDFHASYEFLLNVELLHVSESLAVGTYPTQCLYNYTTMSCLKMVYVCL